MNDFIVSVYLWENLLKYDSHISERYKIYLKNHKKRRSFD